MAKGPATLPGRGGNRSVIQNGRCLFQEGLPQPEKPQTDRILYKEVIYISPVVLVNLVAV
jgi:hypothetical protein